MRVTPISVYNARFSAPKQNIGFGKFADENAKNFIKPKISEGDFYLLNAIGGIILYTDNESGKVKSIRDEKFINDKNLKKEYDYFLDNDDLGIVNIDKATSLSAAAYSLLPREKNWKIPKLKENSDELSVEEQQEIERQARIDNLAD